jgi:PAS domain S-box-containing protein
MSPVEPHQNPRPLLAIIPRDGWLGLAATAGGGVLALWATPFGVAMVGGGVILLTVVTWRQTRKAWRRKARLATLAAERDRLDQELGEARSRYEQILNHASDAMFFVDPHDGTLLEVNRRAEELLGYTRGDIQHLSLGVLFPGRHRRRFLKLVRKILAQGQGEEPELQFRRKDGSLFIGAVQARLGWLGTQRVVHGRFHDATPYVHLTSELRRHNQQLTLLNEVARLGAEGQGLSSILATILDQVVAGFGVAGGGIFLLRHHGTEMSLAFHCGIPQQVLTDLADLRPGDDLIGKVAISRQARLSVDLAKDRRFACAAAVHDGWRAFLAVPLETKESCHGVLFLFERGPRVLNRNDLRLLQAIGRQIGPLVKHTELFDELQWQHRLNQASLRELERSRGALRDNLRQLEQSHRLLQGLDQMKSTFLALASHELRTPLTTIQSGAELLDTHAAAQLDPAGRLALDAILLGGRRLRELVDDLMEAARLEADSIYLENEEFDPQLLAEALAQEFSPRCARRGLNFSLGSVPQGLRIRGDRHHLQRALGRILENAVKFTPEGGDIRLEATLCSGAEVTTMADRLQQVAGSFFATPLATEYLRLCVRDNGIGLAPGDEARIFDKFATVGDIASHSSSRERFGGKGAGLGLTLARGVVAAHDGLLWAESAGEGLGSSFSLLLPLGERGRRTDGD